ncbi:MAG: zinc ribbon domain-containing protein [Planctomycetota bacterium]
MAKKISPERKKLYNAGLVIIIIGLCLLFLPFLAIPVGLIATLIGGGEPGLNFFLGIPCAFVGTFLGMGLFIAGLFMRIIAARGVAGSGLVLDPEKAREDLEPWTRMGGGMVKDALDEADINLNNLGGGSPPEQVVMIKCRECGTLNEDDSKYCQECGKPL